ncbi:TPA: alpha/beta hydrolase fold domain-containing protein [Legionella pneumophila subsp. pneumophila]|nr:alpha/beta hydrolase fold domain-containing protein [Legionella pneumophila]HAT9523240.1 alpha/beta hydrolase fold domain-containing protein [Legionella pneumophila subsp. pneumophila]HAU2156289.1 alpha/beta hydrolase fold domain-containing protein [Legionella pneumophila]
MLGEFVLSVYMKEPLEKAQACVIWMHGLGADASDMMGLADQLTIEDTALRHVFLDAPRRPVTLNGGMVMPAWYDIYGLGFVDEEDKSGIEQSELLIRKVVDAQYNCGFKPHQIFLAGFSQGGAMALHTALHMTERLCGVIALSAYLPLAKHNKPQLDKNTPIFMGAGQFDPLVLPKWTLQSKDWLLANGYNEVSFHQYPMEHSICFEEIKDLSLWLNKQVQGVLQ